MTDEEAKEAYRILWRFIRKGPRFNPDDIGDVMQEAMLFLLKYSDPLPERYDYRGATMVRAIWCGCRDVFGSNRYVRGRRALAAHTFRWDTSDMDDAFPHNDGNPAHRAEVRDELRAALPRLTPRERDIAFRLADGQTMVQIGYAHGISKQAVFQAVGAMRTRAQAWRRR